MPSITATAPVTYRLLRAALTQREPFLQNELAARAEASLAQASNVVRWLADRGHAERLPDGRYRLRGAAGLLTSVFPYERSMNDALAARVSLRASKREALDALVKAGGVLCLESALEHYSQFFRADRVCVYHAEPTQLLDSLRPHEGGILPVHIYVPDLPLEGDVEDGQRTTKFRTALDLACDGRLYAGKELLQDLWGVVLD